MPISLNWNTVAETDSLRDYPEMLDMCILRVTGYMCRTLGVERKEECDWIEKAALRDAHRQIREKGLDILGRHTRWWARWLGMRPNMTRIDVGIDKAPSGVVVKVRFSPIAAP